MKVALVNDYLSQFGGAEQVLFSLHEIFPKAPIYTIFSKADKDKNDLLSQKFKKAKIRQSWFAKLPFCDKLISPLRFLIPLIWASFKFDQYDLVISSASWAITKGFGTEKTKEICYCHTPPRYLYGYETSRTWRKHWYIRLYALIVNHFMRLYDFRQAQKVTWFLANSQEVQARIKKFYRRESVVIWPPVALASRKKQKLDAKPYFLTGGRLERPKNFDLIIKSCNKLKVPLKIYGTGPQEEYLRSISGPTIEFLGFISDDRKQELLAFCQAFIAAAQDEDFGITPVEAMMAGRPVIAFAGGGYLETVVEGKTGEFFDKPTVENLMMVLKNFKPEKYQPDKIQKYAQKFSKERFKEEVRKFVKQRWKRKT